VECSFQFSNSGPRLVRLPSTLHALADTHSGSLIGTIVDNFTAKRMDKGSYLIPLGLIYIVPAFIAFFLFFIPESPRWLLQQEHPEKARKALLWLRPYKEGVEEELADMQAALDADKELEKSTSIIDLVRDPVDRRRTLLAVAAISTQAASGAMFMIGGLIPSY
jgi:MFS transporter, SP family, sugar:H+ symporter